MTKLFAFYGKNARPIATICWLALIVSFAGVLASLAFIIPHFVNTVARADVGVAEIWLDPRHIQALTNSLFVAGIFSGSTCLLSTGVALGLRALRMSGDWRIYLMSVTPLLIPDYVLGVAGRVMFDPTIGVLADLVSKDILSSRWMALTLSVFVLMFKWLPAMIVFADSAIYALNRPEADQASLDFPSFGRAVKLVYWPEIRVILPLIWAMTFLIGFRLHEFSQELTAGGAGFNAELWSIWNYRVVFEFVQVGRAAVESVLAILVLLIPIQIVLRWSASMHAPSTRN